VPPIASRHPLEHTWTLWCAQRAVKRRSTAATTSRGASSCTQALRPAAASPLRLTPAQGLTTRTGGKSRTATARRCARCTPSALSRTFGGELAPERLPCLGVVSTGCAASPFWLGSCDGAVLCPLAAGRRQRLRRLGWEASLRVSLGCLGRQAGWRRRARPCALALLRPSPSPCPVPASADASLPWSACTTTSWRPPS